MTVSVKLTDEVTINGETLTIREWCWELGIYPDVIRYRVELGWTLARAIATPMRSKPGKELDLKRMPTALPKPPVLHTFKGITLSLAEWSRETGLNPDTIQFRLKRGWSIEDALTRPVNPQANRGLGKNLPAQAGTGGGSVAEDSDELEFSTEAAK